MTYLWIALGALAALLIAVVVVGSLMPERYEGFTRATLAASTEKVWEALADVERHPMTGRMMKAVERQPDENGMPTWVEDMGHGERITVRTVESERPQRLVREMASQAVPMTSRWEYTLEPKDDACALAISGVTFIRRGTWHVPLFRVMMKLGGGVKKGLDIQVDMVAATLGVSPERG